MDWCFIERFWSGRPLPNACLSTQFNFSSELIGVSCVASVATAAAVAAPPVMPVITLAPTQGCQGGSCGAITTSPPPLPLSLHQQHTLFMRHEEGSLIVVCVCRRVLCPPSLPLDSGLAERTRPVPFMQPLINTLRMEHYIQKETMSLLTSHPLTNSCVCMCVCCAITMITRQDPNCFSFFELFKAYRAGIEALLGLTILALG